MVKKYFKCYKPIIIKQKVSRKWAKSREKEKEKERKKGLKVVKKLFIFLSINKMSILSF